MSTETTTGLLLLKVLTPEGSVLEGDVSEVTLPGSEGELGVLPAHAALLTKIIPGALAYRAPEGQGIIALGRGVAEVRDDRVIVLVERAVPAEEIDAAAVEARRKQLLAERDTAARITRGAARGRSSEPNSAPESQRAVSARVWTRPGVPASTPGAVLDDRQLAGPRLDPQRSRSAGYRYSLDPFLLAGFCRPAPGRAHPRPGRRRRRYRPAAREGATRRCTVTGIELQPDLARHAAA